MNSVRSSSSYTDTYQYKDGLLGDSPQNYFRDWTVVMFKYCTGTGHQGYKKDPIKYKDTSLYFRGHNATIGLMNNLLQRHNFHLTKKLVISGQSAGGLAVYVWSEYLTKLANSLSI